ncbi:MAG TPA: hypothetical protein DCP03_17135 [Polaromonas sp.]|nr:hypothetical protein [Polaromonas sp.]
MNNQKTSKCRSFAQWLLIIVTLTASFSALAQSGALACGELRSGYGPFDYRTDRDKLGIVEQYHFTPEVEALIRGKSSIHIGQDLSYTLGTFPNHHRALMSMMRYGEKLKTPQPPYAEYSVECYFLRALRFRPDDTTVRLMYATFLNANARAPEAMQELEQVAKAAGDNPFTCYNMGLIYLDMKEYEKALALAHKAMALGFGQTGLRDKLMAIGKWRAPEVPLPPEQLNPVQK